MAEETPVTTYQEAITCPKCGKPGNVRKREPVPRSANLPHGTQLHTAYCETPLCPWEGLVCRLVQVNPDGSIPPPQDHRGKPKVYEHFEGHDQMARDIMRALNNQVAAETDPDHHGEIRKRY
jgi:hypothetical protein